jgi:hypothetical protein
MYNNISKFAIITAVIVVAQRLLKNQDIGKAIKLFMVMSR